MPSATEAVPSPTSTPDDPLPEQPAPAAIGNLLEWDEARAGRGAITREESVDVAREPWDPAAAGLTARYYASIDELVTVDGSEQPAHPADAFTWMTTVDLDPTGGYVYIASDGVAEPGDAGCSQFLEIDSSVWMRSTFGPVESNPGLDFVAQPDEPSAISEILAEAVYDADELWSALSVEPERAFDHDGVTIERADLEGRAAVDAVDELGGPVGNPERYDRARLELVADRNGSVRVITLVAGWEEASEDRQARRATLYTQITFEPFDDDAPRVTSTTSILDAPGCRAPTAELPGRWEFAGLLTPGGGIGAEAIDQIAGGHLDVAADGMISGSFGCRSFAGSATIGFRTLGDLDIDITGDRCVDLRDELPEGELEDAVIAIFDGPIVAVTIDLEGRLFLNAPTDGGDPDLAVVYRRG